MSRRDGGPAFPRIDGVEVGDYGRQHYFVEEGLSVRDYFAAQALAGILAAHSGTDVKMPTSMGAATRAYEYADAMLAAKDGAS